MTPEEIRNLHGRDNPCLCADGRMGMLIIYPHQNCTRCGIQVPGEEDIRWIEPGALTGTRGGALKQEGAPSLPTRPSGQDDTAHVLLSMDWARRGPEFVLDEVPSG